MVHGHGTSLKYYAFGYRSVSAKMEILDRRDDLNDVILWAWPDDTGVVTFEGVKVDPKGMLFVAAFNSVTYRTPSPMVVYGNDMFAPPTPQGYLFEIKPTGTDHTITQTLTSTDGFASAIDALTKGGSATLTAPFGNVGGTASTTHTDPTNNGSTARSGTNTYTVKVVEGISVNKALKFQSIQSMNGNASTMVG